jgi:hypothetical protein
MESRFGHDFRRVRVHTDAKAAESARAVNALAYTVGRDVVFENGRYPPHSIEGQRLLAHELAHVAQQGDAGLRRSASVRLGSADSPAEAEAEAVASRIVAEGGGGSGIEEISPPDVLRRQTPPPGQWSAREEITAGVGNRKDDCWSAVDPQGRYHTPDGSNRPYSEVCAFLDPVCAHVWKPLNFAFHVDRWGEFARPEPFLDSRVAINLVLLPDSGGRTPVFSATSNGIYLKPGLALLTSFDFSVPFELPEPGTLLVSMVHSDPSSGEVAVYADEIPIVDCTMPAERLFGQPTGIYVVIPDPINAPLVYHRLGAQDSLDQPGITVEVERDEAGLYFYLIEEQKYYLPERP